MTTIAIEPIAKTWNAFRASSGIGHIRSEAQYERIMDLMDELADLGAMDESSELHELFMLAADVVRQYESLHYPDPKVSGVEMLRFLMGQHERSTLGDRGHHSPLRRSDAARTPHHCLSIAHVLCCSVALIEATSSARASMASTMDCCEKRAIHSSTNQSVTIAK